MSELEFEIDWLEIKLIVVVLGFWSQKFVMTEYVMPKIALEDDQTVSKLGSVHHPGIAML